MHRTFYLAGGAVERGLCDRIVQAGLLLPPQKASIGFTQDRVDDQYRVSTIRWFNPHEKGELHHTLLYHFHIANRTLFGFDISYGLHDIQFTEYYGDVHGKYDWHHDVFWQNTNAYDRKLSIVIQLSDPKEYEGGDFEFREPMEYNPSMFKQKGSVLVFPSFFVHRVTPITKGTRYSLVAWIDGPKFR